MNVSTEIARTLSIPLQSLEAVEGPRRGEWTYEVRGRVVAKASLVRDLTGDTGPTGGPRTVVTITYPDQVVERTLPAGAQVRFP